MVVILERYEFERLQYTIQRLPHRIQNFGHAVDRPRLRLEGNFHKFALHQRLRQTEQATGS